MEDYQITIKKDDVLKILNSYYASQGIQTDIKVRAEIEYLEYGMSEKKSIVPIFSREREINIGNCKTTATSKISLEEIKQIIGNILLENGLEVKSITFNTHYIDYYESSVDFGGVTISAKLDNQKIMKRTREQL